jgi:hypothetical protein
MGTPEAVKGFMGCPRLNKEYLGTTVIIHNGFYLG